jgi:hypothetical protein
MRPSTLILIAGLAACLTSSAGSFGAEPTAQQPTLAPPQTAGQPIEERLARLEMQLQLIQRHLGLRYRLPPASSGADSTLPDQSTDSDRLSRLEQETRRFGEQVEQMQRQLEGATPPSRVAPVPAQGRLVVQNLTGVPHYLSVNKVQHYVQPGRTDILVPCQVVEAYLPSHELPKLLGMSLWRWTGRDYEMPLEIKN